MTKEHVEIEEASRLPGKTIAECSEIWKDHNMGEFPFKNSRASKYIFFIARSDTGAIRAVGTLQPIRIKYLDKTYKILGIGGIVAVIKGRGYGRTLMTAIRNYATEHMLTGVGFCGRKHSGFYAKCGFKIAENLVQNFLYKDPEGKLIKNRGDDDVLYVNGTDGFMTTVLANKDKVVLLTQPHW